MRRQQAAPEGFDGRVIALGATGGTPGRGRVGAHRPGAPRREEQLDRFGARRRGRQAASPSGLLAFAMGGGWVGRQRWLRMATMTSRAAMSSTATPGAETGSSVGGTGSPCGASAKASSLADEDVVDVDAIKAQDVVVAKRKAQSDRLTHERGQVGLP